MNWPSLGVFFHSICQSLRLERVMLKGIDLLSDVASLASSSALSLPGISQWLGDNETSMERFFCASRSGLRVW